MSGSEEDLRMFSSLTFRLSRCRAAADPSGTEFAFAFQQNWLWMERFITIDSLTIKTLLGALAGVFVICVIFLDLVR